MDKFLVAPSTDPIKSVEEIIMYANEIQDEADLLHCDIMDGKFVEKYTYSFNEIKKIKERVLLPLDVHLMVESPTKQIKPFIKNGANILTIHYEAYKNKKQIISDLRTIKKLGALAGLSIKPNTQINEITAFLSYCDVVLIMSVEPGKSGQTFIESSYEKIVDLNKIKDEYNILLKIEVDGGVNPEISAKLKELGANIVVSGNFVYSSPNKILAIKSLKGN